MSRPRAVKSRTRRTASCSCAAVCFGARTSARPCLPIPTMCCCSTRRRRDLVEAVKLMISERLERPPSLTELADVLGCSPYHLSHTFHGTAGLSLRGYVRRLRARVAAERLAAGASHLTALALDLGYADHSHFTNSFRREWGVSPSTFRSRLVTTNPGKRHPAQRACYFTGLGAGHPGIARTWSGTYRTFPLADSFTKPVW